MINACQNSINALHYWPFVRGEKWQKWGKQFYFTPSAWFVLLVPGDRWIPFKIPSNAKSATNQEDFMICSPTASRSFQLLIGHATAARWTPVFYRILPGIRSPISTGRRSGRGFPTGSHAHMGDSRGWLDPQRSTNIAELLTYCASCPGILLLGYILSSTHTNS